MNEELHFNCIKEIIELGFGETISESLFSYEPTYLNHFVENKLYLAQHIFAKDKEDECLESIVIFVTNVKNDKIEYKIVYHDIIFKYIENDEIFTYKQASKKVSDLIVSDVIISNNSQVAIIPVSLGTFNGEKDDFGLEISSLSGASLKDWRHNK